MAELTKWVLVAGTGRNQLPDAERWSAEQLGRVLAEQGYGVVTGGWQGVDDYVARAFAKHLAPDRDLASYLIQVVPDGRQPEFQGGYVIPVESGEREWTEAVKYADAVVLIGGLGGTYNTYRFAQLEFKPVLPLAATERDARRAFNDIVDDWEVASALRVPRDDYVRALDAPILSADDVVRVVDGLMELLGRHFQPDAPGSASERRRVFISYSHRDRPWLDRLRLMIKPLERRGLEVWADTDIEAGQRWKEEISGALASTAVAVFLVSPDFVGSDFITAHELPPLLQAAEQNRVKILWIYLSACLFDETGLDALQAAHDISQPLDALAPAQQNEQLVKVAKLIRSQAAPLTR
ncbi:MAG TPA: TIR domain-containing protein [Longimicrobium sp.]|nr:TIR domain-containing protein [Longimicrobium sp.]